MNKASLFIRIHVKLSHDILALHRLLNLTCEVLELADTACRCLNPADSTLVSYKSPILM